jgi:hypothetical protein
MDIEILNSLESNKFRILTKSENGDFRLTLVCNKTNNSCSKLFKISDFNNYDIYIKYLIHKLKLKISYKQ